MKFSSEFGGVTKTRTLHEEAQWDTEFAKFVKGESRQVVPGINSGHVPAAIFGQNWSVPRKRSTDVRLGQQDEVDPTIA